MVLKHLSLFFAIFFLISGCDRGVQPPAFYKLTSEEHAWMEEFFTGIMLQNRAIYTLCGSKPMTRIMLYYYTPEEIQAAYDQMTEEERKNALYLEDYHLAENWEKWEQISGRFPMNRYVLYKKDDTGTPKAASLYFVDQLKVAYLLLENYSVFKMIVGMDFEPFLEAFQIKEGSVFWEKVKDNAALHGLLFGYGLKNSFSFYWKYWGKSGFGKQCMNGLPSYLINDMVSGKSTISNLSLPEFISFYKEDEVLQKYKKERTAIRKEYQGKDFLSFTLEKLTMPS